MGRFPHVRISDDVRAQEQLLREKFGIEQLQLVTGGSMGVDCAPEHQLIKDSELRVIDCVSGHWASSGSSPSIWSRSTVTSVSSSARKSDLHLI